ncbi:MAG: TIGR04014 family B12-binding domain/radical SAM domain-containing protein [Methanolinea sp.]|nr:TIGR04014 family B12-binding domain/radical SAM domain-containing protein [Methanolinea sp.]
MQKQVRIFSPEVYTYGAMLIGGILKDAGIGVTLVKSPGPCPEKILLLSLYSTQHLLDPRIRSYIQHHRERGGLCYAGGPVSAAPEMVLGELGIDAVVVGEGENAIVPLVLNGVSPDIPGIAYNTEKGLCVTHPDFPAALDRPLPLIPDDIDTQNIRGANVYIESHRGCLGACTFCQVPRFFGHQIRSRKIQDILLEVKAFREKGVRRISISGGTGSLFGYTAGKLNPDAFIELLSGMAGIMGSANVSAPDIRVDCISDEILEAIRKYTIGWVFFGIESGSDRILSQMGKGVSLSQVKAAIEACRSHGLKVAGSFIVGYPTETEEDYAASREFIAEQCLDDVFVSIAEPIPGTPLSRLVLRTPREENPLFQPDKGKYRSLGLSIAETRCFDLMMEADMYKPQLHVITDQIFDLYLKESKKQGSEIRAVTDLLFRYSDSFQQDGNH